MKRLKTNIVPPDGPVDATICFIAEAPGVEENASLIPLIGSAGQLFNRCLHSRNIVRSSVLCHNVFVQKPPNNKVKYFYQSYPTKPTWEGQEHIENLRVWLTTLLKQREETGKGPNVLVALGGTALYHLTGRKRISKWRGSVLPCTLVPGFKVYPMYHPSYVMRLMNEPEERTLGLKKTQKLNALPTFIMDLERVKEQAKFPEIRREEREIEILWDLETIQLYLTQWSPSYVAVDIETVKGENGLIIWCIGFSSSPDSAFVIPFLKTGKFYWSAEEETIIWSLISRLFLNKNSNKIFHNGGFDLSVLGRYYGIRCAPGTYQDTMWCWQSTYPDLLKGLDFLTSLRTWEPYYKDDGKYWDGRRISDDAEFIYNGKDVCVTRELWPIISNEARIKGTWTNYQNSMKVMPSLLWIMINGVKFDNQKKLHLEEDIFAPKMLEAKDIINNEVGREVNLESSDQLQKLLYGYLDMPVQYHHKTKRPTVDKDALNRLLKLKPKDPILNAIKTYKQFSILVKNFTSIDPGSDGRVKTSYGFISTFRVSSSESLFGGGGNLQNIPTKKGEGKELRTLFTADDGMIMLAVDLAQAEDREVTWEANDFETMEAYKSGTYDVHWRRAQTIFRIPEQVPYIPTALFKSPIIGEERTMWELRQMGKTIVHASNYGMGPRMLQTILIREGVYLEYSICVALLEQAKRSRPLVIQWQENIKAEIRISRTLVGGFGDKRQFNGRMNDALFRSAFAYKPQNTVGRIAQFGAQRILENVTYYCLLMNVHDEVIGQLKPNLVHLALHDIKAYMEIPHETGGRTLTIPTDFKIGPNWGELEEVENESHAKELVNKFYPGTY